MTVPNKIKYGKVSRRRPIIVIDFETDPFEHGALIEPFAGDVYDGKRHVIFWGADCVSRMSEYLATLRPSIIYAHNGGKFDALFFMRRNLLADEMLVIDGRIVKAKLGEHELRDSYSIIPIPLAAYKKDEIDYKKFKKVARDRHRTEIVKYLEADCVYLFDLVSRFIERFSTKITIGATAMSELKKTVDIIRSDKAHDTRFRPFYFGGRVQCFEWGELRGDFKIIDVNSMYPHVMKEYSHPIGSSYIGGCADDMNPNGSLKRFGNSTYFLEFEGWHAGVIPTRTKTKGLSFEEATGRFWACSHEVKAALAAGLMRIDDVVSLHIPCSEINFSAYVDKFMIEKIAAKASGDKVSEIFAKLLLNSAYGKFATNPEGFKSWFIRLVGVDDSEDKFVAWQENNPKCEMEYDLGDVEIWWALVVESVSHKDMLVGDKPFRHSYYDVATAASITSAARAVLMHAIGRCRRPIYCDTDSLICEGTGDLPIHRSALGSWAMEATADTLYIAGRKLYACYLQGDVVKMASKGAQLEGHDIATLCRGSTVTWRSGQPNFKLDGSQTYTTRNINARFPAAKIVDKFALELGTV